MVYCKVVSCYQDKNYSGESYCSYHGKCLQRLRRSYVSFSNIEVLDTFETGFNGNCGGVITYDYSSSSSYPYYIGIVIYEPSGRSIGDNISAIRYDNGASLSYAREEAQELKIKLQNSNGGYDTPMLEVHPKANSYEYFSSLITSPYVKKNEVGNGDSSHFILFVRVSGTTPYELDRYFKPLDIVKIKEVNKLFGIMFYHVGIYLGDVGGGNRICHFSRKSNGVRITNGDSFLRDRIGELYRYHPVIPFKNPWRIAEQIAWSYSNNFREDQYDLYNRNCEHFANMCVYGINYSEQIGDRKASIEASRYARAGLIVPTLGLSLIGAPDNVALNNGKGSTIRLTSEMSESNGKLGEKDNSLSGKIKANVEIPSKEYCKIM